MSAAAALAALQLLLTSNYLIQQSYSGLDPSTREPRPAPSV